MSRFHESHPRASAGREEIRECHDPSDFQIQRQELEFRILGARPSLRNDPCRGNHRDPERNPERERSPGRLGRRFFMKDGEKAPTGTGHAILRATRRAATEEAHWSGRKRSGAHGAVDLVGRARDHGSRLTKPSTGRSRWPSAADDHTKRQHA